MSRGSYAEASARSAFLLGRLRDLKAKCLFAHEPSRSRAHDAGGMITSHDTDLDPRPAHAAGQELSGECGGHRRIQ